MKPTREEVERNIEEQIVKAVKMLSAINEPLLAEVVKLNYQNSKIRIDALLDENEQLRADCNCNAKQLQRLLKIRDIGADKIVKWIETTDSLALAEQAEEIERLTESHRFFHDDVVTAMEALGISVHARPESDHAVFKGEVLPAIERQAAEIEMLKKQLVIATSQLRSLDNE